MRATSIFTAAVSMNAAEFRTRLEGVTISEQSGFSSTLVGESESPAGFSISKFGYATECIALRFSSGQRTRTICKPV
jgi:hypothetical protein